jgi:nucleotide-binding universal stress UspA family protein
LVAFRPIRQASGRPTGERRRGTKLKFLLATDGSRESVAACRFLRQLALPPGSAMRVLAVAPEPPVLGAGLPWTTPDPEYTEVWEEREAALCEAEALLAAHDVPVIGAIRQGDPVTKILLDAEEYAADLVGVSSKGLTGLRGFLQGSIARAIIERCERPVAKTYSMGQTTWQHRPQE